MGMFDDLVIDKAHLPKELKDYEKGWQTKSLDCYMDVVEIDSYGRLFLYELNKINENNKIIIIEIVLNNLFQGVEKNPQKNVFIIYFLYFTQVCLSPTSPFILWITFIVSPLHSKYPSSYS